jgi:hypothetical protein
MAPYGRILNSNDTDQGEDGTFGFLGSRTEQFALGSIYYLINYGFEFYGDHCLTADPYDHDPKVVDLLRDMKLPKLDGKPLIDDIIDKCWHNQYVKISDLAARTKKHLHESPDQADESRTDECERQASNRVKIPLETTTIFQWRMTAERDNGENTNPVDEIFLGEDFRSKKQFCQDLEQRGLLQLLSSGEPEQIGFKLAWYRHSLKV